jgi:hypothetical protein
MAALRPATPAPTMPTFKPVCEDMMPRAGQQKPEMMRKAYAVAKYQILLPRIEQKEID